MENINIGTVENDGTGDKLRNAFSIVNENFDEFEIKTQEIDEELDLKLDKSTTPSSVYTTDAAGLQVMKPLSEFGGGEIYIKNISVSGGYPIDFNVDTHRLTLIGNTTFTEINLPPVGFSKTITLHINGNFGVVFPASWAQYISGAYNGTAPLNTIVIETIGTERKVQISQPD